jgi:hypothetical protein
MVEGRGSRVEVEEGEMSTNRLSKGGSAARSGASNARTHDRLHEVLRTHRQSVSAAVQSQYAIPRSYPRYGNMIGREIVSLKHVLTIIK